MVTTEREVAAAEDPPPRRRRRRKARPAPGPVARFQPGKVAEPRHRNPIWLIAGLLLVLGSALAGVLLFSANDDRTEALVASRDLAQGEVIERDDLRIERVALDGGVESVTPALADELVGQHVIGPVPEGALLHPAMMAPDAPLGPDEMDIGAALDPGEFPQTDIPIGATVELLVSTPSEAGSATPGSAPPSAGTAEASSIGVGTVTAVEERATGQLLVTMRVPRDVGLVASQAARDDTLRVALVGGDA